MSNEVLDQVLQNDSVPTIPAFALKVVELCAKPDVSLAEVGEVIQHDAATSAKILRLANSPLYGLTREVSSVPQAVSLLGLSTVRMLSVATALVGGLGRKNRSGMDTREFWRSALVTSLSAFRIADTVRARDVEQSFIAGLLQNLGVYLMCNALGNRYTDLLEEAKSNPSKLADMERDQFGVTHAEVGAQLMQSWNFPQKLVQAVEIHEDEDLAPQKDLDQQLGAVLRAADGYRAVFLCPDPGQVQHLLATCQKLLGLSQERVVEILSYVETNVSLVAQAFDLDIGDPQIIADARHTATSELVELMLGTMEQNRSEHEIHGLSVLRLEIDHPEVIKEQTDERGFEKAVAATESAVHSKLGKTDVLLRWGTAGFLVVKPDGREEVVRELGEELVSLVGGTPVKTAKGEIKVTISIGGAHDSELRSEHFQQFLDAAEKGLGQAVSAGGGQFVASPVGVAQPT